MITHSDVANQARGWHGQGHHHHGPSRAMHSPPDLGPAQHAMIADLVHQTAQTEIMPRFRHLRPADIAQKSGPLDLVTEADTAAETMLSAGLHRLFPGAAILGEEAAQATPGLRDAAAKAPLAFIIDPVDGTWNFAHGLAMFGVIIAATRYGRPIFGLIHDPVAQDDVMACENSPARHISADGQVRPLSVAQPKPLAAMQGYVHLSLMPKARQHELAPRLTRFARTDALRCSAHEYRQAAQGHIDFLASPQLPPWDHAAGVLIYQQAGGVARLMDGRDYHIGTTEGTLLCAPSQNCWQAVAQVLQP